MTPLTRAGGLKLDPAVAAWQKQAATNTAALTRKQKRDKKRLHVMYDLKPDTKDAVVKAAKLHGTSASQMAAFLLEFAIRELRSGNEEIKAAISDGRSPSGTMKFEFNLDAPDEWLSTEIDKSDHDGKV